MITELVIIYLTFNSFFIWLCPNVGGDMVSGNRYSNLSEFDRNEIIILMSLGVVVFLFAYLPLKFLEGDKYGL